MKIKPLEQFNDSNDYIYIDANIFHLAVRDQGKLGQSCVNFLKKIENGTINGITSVLVLDELMYKLLLKMIEAKYNENPLIILREKKVDADIFATVATLIDDIISIKNLKIVDIPKTIAFVVTHNFKIFHLLPRDTLHISLMELYDIKNIASADSDFDSVNWIIRWSPL